MNERHLCRGRRIDNGEWIIGGYALTGEMHIIFAEHEAKEIDPATIGQCTGLRDSKRADEYPNGQLIFEGDIIRTSEDCEPVYTVYWCGGREYPAYDVDPEIDTGSNGLAYLYAAGYDIEIIGKIHDNPELLGVDKGGQR